MFYSTELLNRKHGKFGFIWLVAMAPRRKVSKLSRREYSRISVSKTCCDVQFEGGRLSLRLCAQLMIGIIRVCEKQTRYLLDDVTVCVSKMRLSFIPAPIDLPPRRIHSKDAVTLPADCFFADFDYLDYEPPAHLNFVLDFPPVLPINQPTGILHQCQEREDNLSYKALQASLDETFDEEGDGDFFVWEQAVDADIKKGLENEDDVIMFDPQSTSFIPGASCRNVDNSNCNDQEADQETYHEMPSHSLTQTDTVCNMKKSGGNKRGKRPPMDPLTVIPAKVFRHMMDESRQTLREMKDLYCCTSSHYLSDPVDHPLMFAQDLAVFHIDINQQWKSFPQLSELGGSSYDVTDALDEALSEDALSSHFLLGSDMSKKSSLHTTRTPVIPEDPMAESTPMFDREIDLANVPDRALGGRTTRGSKLSGVSETHVPSLVVEEQYSEVADFGELPHNKSASRQQVTDAENRLLLVLVERFSDCGTVYLPDLAPVGRTTCHQAAFLFSLLCALECEGFMRLSQAAAFAPIEITKTNKFTEWARRHQH